jgi:hypothetical protein
VARLALQRTTGENELLPALPTEKFEVQLQGDDVLVDLASNSN